MALLPIGLSISLSLFVAFDHVFGNVGAWAAALTSATVVAFCWFMLGIILGTRYQVRPMIQPEQKTPLSVKIEQMLTEARVVLSGAQALIGFQLTVILTEAFDKLPASVKMLHMAALCCVTFAVILMMTPAALHRLTF